MSPKPDGLQPQSERMQQHGPRLREQRVEHTLLDSLSEYRTPPASVTVSRSRRRPLRTAPEYRQDANPGVGTRRIRAHQNTKNVTLFSAMNYDLHDEGSAQRQRRLHVGCDERIEFGTSREALFASKLPLEFADRLRLQNSDGTLNTEACVVAVQYNTGKTAVAARFAQDIPNWIIKS